MRVASSRALSRDWPLRSGITRAGTTGPALTRRLTWSPRATDWPLSGAWASTVSRGSSLAT